MLHASKMIVDLENEITGVADFLIVFFLKKKSFNIVLCSERKTSLQASFLGVELPRELAG